MESQENYRAKERFVAYILNFLFTLHFTLPVYATSSYLASLSNEEWVGFIYAGAYMASIIMLALLPRILSKIGNYKILLITIFIELFALIGLAFSHSILWAVLFFVISSAVVTLARGGIDIFMENFSSDQKTGLMRGYFNTAGNLAWVVSPLITGLILKDSDYSLIFLAAAIILIPSYILSMRYINKFKDPEYRKVDYRQAIKEIVSDRDLGNIFLTKFLLQFFFVWMIIYTPLYLNINLGFDWSTIGAIFAVMLLPYIFIEIPLGKMADSRWGEKEGLAVGFIIMAISTGAISLISGGSVLMWMILLLLTRVGASMVEAMCETYFFKKIDSSKAHLISSWHMVYPLAYILSPLIATPFLMAFDIKYTFLFLGLLMFYGLQRSLSLNDTR